MSGLASLDAWFLSQCDGDWEHGYGIQINTTDNPGWHLKIDLWGLEHRITHEISDNSLDDGEGELLLHFTYDPKSKKLDVYTAPGRLDEAIAIFLRNV